MLASIQSASLLGIDACPITVEVDVSAGLPHWTIVGLASGAVKESRDRVLSAIANAGFRLPARRVTCNLAPADQRKDTSAFDLPIALCLLAALGYVAPEKLVGVTAVGELALDGRIRPVRGALSIARLAARQPSSRLLLPATNVAEAILVSGNIVGGPSTLVEAFEQLESGTFRTSDVPPQPSESPRAGVPDLSEVKGQPFARRALEIAAAGDHGMLLIGPPGSGKTLLARSFPGLLPPLAEPEALEVIAVQSVAGLITGAAVVHPARPFRAPHHTVSTAGLVGGGSGPRPGEITLAHRGVLFLDEVLEFPRRTLDAMRQPMEDGHVVISRASGSIKFPAQFSLIVACNPCPCGWAGSDRCQCSHAEIVGYRARLSGPMSDRIDLHVTVAALPVRDLGAPANGESSIVVRERVTRARCIQRERYRRMPGVLANGRAPGKWLDHDNPIDPAARDLLIASADQLRLSARGYHRVLRVARTIADLDGDKVVSTAAVAESIRYRPT